MRRLNGRVAIITGAARGIGAEFACGLAAEGAKVTLADINPPDHVVEKIKQNGGSAIGLVADVGQADQVAAMVTATIDAFGGVDILVNNAAIFSSLEQKPFWEVPDEEWELIMRINTLGPQICTKAVVPHMMEKKYGKIINISSGVAFKGAPGMTAYAASKGAVLVYTRSVARELGDYNICVNAIAPGFTESEGVIANQSMSQALKDMQVQMRAFKRVMQVSDLTGTLIYLASSDSDFVTGQTILVDGGAINH